MVTAEGSGPTVACPLTMNRRVAQVGNLRFCRLAVGWPWIWRSGGGLPIRATADCQYALRFRGSMREPLVGRILTLAPAGRRRNGALSTLSPPEMNSGNRSLFRLPPTICGQTAVQLKNCTWNNRQERKERRENGMGSESSHPGLHPLGEEKSSARAVRCPSLCALCVLSW
jgi:hypothetical protein